jgi:2-desacetyl-2-hydroxyethyl bacteriochlorophyllide A dehydrogenase
MPLLASTGQNLLQETPRALMKAVVCTRYGPPEVLVLKEVEKPIPSDDDVLVRVHAATAARGDCELRGLKLPLLLQLPVRLGFGFRGPRKKILGQELAGEVVSIGKNVTLFKAGDKVFAFTGFRLGAYAQYDCLGEKSLMTTMPSNATYEEAAAVPVGGLHALHLLNRAHIQPGQRVLIVGAGGSIGTFAVQIAKSFGTEVTGVDSAKKLAVVKAIGADHVIDYEKEDFTRNGQTYDVIFDVIGKSSFSRSIRSLTENGFYLLGNPGLGQQLRSTITTRKGGKRVIGGMVAYSTQDLVFLKGLIEAGKMKPVIDRTYPLEEIVEAHRYVDGGQKIGNVAVSVP